MKDKREKKKRPIFPRSLIKSLSEDIKNLMETSEGRLLALEILDEIPYDLRPHVIDGLSSFYYPEIVDFFYLVKEEYGKELDAVCNRALEKFQMAGMVVKAPRLHRSKFYRAYVTRTRHTGQVTLDVAWKNPRGTLDVECFFLSYNTDGLHGFFVISEMPVAEYESDRSMLPDMIEVSLEEACSMVKESYAYNVSNMTRPALGRFLYNKYMKNSASITEEQSSELLNRLTPELVPKEVVNTFFYAQRHRDISYILSLMNKESTHALELLERLNELLAPRLLLVEGQALQAKTSGSRCIVKAYSIYADEDELYRDNITFTLARSSKHWLISNMIVDEKLSISETRDENPFQDKVECYVYEILDMEELFKVLEEIEDIREVGELPFGVHLRVTRNRDNVKNGVFFLTGVLADIVVNGDELVVIAQDPENVMEIDRLLSKNPNSVRSTSHHRVEIITAYSYLSGQYLNFEDVLADENEELFFEDGLKFLTARYLIRDKEKIRDKLRMLKGISYKLPGECEVFYEFSGGKRESLMAEYVVGENWITVSAFGDKELSLVRDKFETGIREYLEFEGMEIKCEGIFELITADVKKQHPDLETWLKQAYLNKWYKSKLKPLRGLTPQDAAKSVEGKSLLWRMFKEMRRKEKICMDLGVRRAIDIKEYIDKVEMRKD
ncbi:MAG: hypothetical protein ACM3PP_12595 [Candidatus Saccharibacteria bacterium]